MKRFRYGEYNVQVSRLGGDDYIEVFDQSGRKIASATRSGKAKPRVTATSIEKDQALFISMEACIQLDLSGDHNE